MLLFVSLLGGATVVRAGATVVRAGATVVRAGATVVRAGAEGVRAGATVVHGRLLRATIESLRRKLRQPRVVHLARHTGLSGAGEFVAGAPKHAPPPPPPPPPFLIMFVSDPSTEGGMTI